MEILNYPDAKTVVICGDIHGDFKPLVHKLCNQLGLKDTLLIVAGDCGFGFDKPAYYVTVYNQIAGLLRKANNWVVFVRGNHDEPSYFAEQRINYTRWRTVPDYSVIRANGHNILCVGGAVSIDRAMRIPKNTKEKPIFWADEAPVFRPDEIQSIPADIKIDTVVTHTAPSRCEFTSNLEIQIWAKEFHDTHLLRDCEQERKALDMLEEKLKNNGHPLQNWYYGHFHASWTRTMDGTTLHMLDIMELKELREYPKSNE